MDSNCWIINVLDVHQDVQHALMANAQAVFMDLYWIKQLVVHLFAKGNVNHHVQYVQVVNALFVTLDFL